MFFYNFICILYFSCTSDESQKEDESSKENIKSEESTKTTSKKEQKSSTEQKEEKVDVVADEKVLTDVLPQDISKLSFDRKNKFGRPPPKEAYRFNLPSGIAVDSKSGDFYVADTINRVIHRYDSNGKFIKLWKCDPLSGVTVDPTNGSLLVALPGLKEIVRYDNEGKELARYDITVEDEKINYAIDMTVHPDGRIFVLHKPSYVVVYDSNGKFIEKWIALPLTGDPKAKDGYIKGSFRSMSIAISQDAQYLYVINSGRTKVQKYTISGKFLKEWGGEKNETPGNIRWSRGITVNKNEEIIVADTDNERLQMFTSDGEYIRWFRGPHSEKDGIFHPRAVDVNVNTGKIYAAAAYSHRIDIFDAVGKYEKSIGGINKEVEIINEPRNITVDPQTGKVYVSARRDHSFRRFSADGEPEKWFIFSGGDLSAFRESWRYQALAQFPGPLEFDLDGNMWAIRGGYHYPEDPTPFDYFRQFDKEGNFLSTMHNEELSGYMEGFDIHRETGDFFVTHTTEKHIIHLKKDGSLVKTFGSEYFKRPSGIAIDEKRERLYVSDSQSDVVQVFSLGGEHLGSFGSTGRKQGEFRFKINTIGIEVDDCGLVYVADPGNRRVSVFTPEGKQKATLSIEGAPSPRPKDISFHDNQIYIVGEGYVQKYERKGVACSE